MTSLRKKVSSYFRQLSFHNEPRGKRLFIHENAFVNKYLRGEVKLKDSPVVLHGKSPNDLPNFDIGEYCTGPQSITGCATGPNGGLTTVKRIEKHLSIPDVDIDYIDTIDSQDEQPKGPNVLEKWDKKTDHIYGISDSLYDCNQVTREKQGNPIADCFGIIARGDSAILALADGVNWGEKACIAAKSAVHGAVHYINKTIFDDVSLFNFEIGVDETSPIDVTNLPPMGGNQKIENTNEVFVCLLRAFNSAHNLILENSGMLTTLTVAVVLPLKGQLSREGLPPTGLGPREGQPREGQLPQKGQKFICCCCNLGDTFAYVYSPKTGIREITKGSHDILSNRDMRDALGALGPVDGINPELNNLTLSATTVEPGDIVFVASDGLTDNYDPSVCKFTINQLLKKKNQPLAKSSSTSRVLKTTPSTPRNPGVPGIPGGPGGAPGGSTKHRTNFLRSKTSLDMKPPSQIKRNEDGLPFVTPLQKYELTLLLMEDILLRNTASRSVSSKHLTQTLINHTILITASKRRVLEDKDLYYDLRGDVQVELSAREKKSRRKRCLEKVQNLPGKLDHVTVVAYTVGGGTEP